MGDPRAALFQKYLYGSLLRTMGNYAVFRNNLIIIVLYRNHGVMAI